MERSVLLQLAQREILEKFIVNYNKDGKDRRTAKYYAKRLKDFQALWDEALLKHRELLVMKLSNPQEAEKLSYFTDDVFAGMETHFIANYAAIEERFERDFPAESPSFDKENSEAESKNIIAKQRSNESIKMPKISLEKFYGDYRKWPTFHDLFRTLVHENESLPAVQKLQYLKLHLGGEAENLLRHLLVTENNYNIAWNILRDRYNNKRVLVNTHLKAMLSQGTVAQETAGGIKGLLDTTTECLYALENLEIDVSNWDALIVYLVVQRLPTETHQLWEQKLSNSTDLPSWSDLQDFLKCRFRTLEAVTNRRQACNKDNRSQVPTIKRSTQAFHTAQSGPICCVCAGQHKIRQCDKFSSMDSMRKLEIVKSKGLCINCLGFGHMLVNCPSKQRCSQCKQRHHSLLHREQEGSSNTRQDHVHFQKARTTLSGEASRTSREGNCSQGQSVLSESSPPFIPATVEENPSQINSFLINDNMHKPEILLATALVRVVAPSGREQVVRALIDQGSQASFVSEHISQTLRLAKESIRADISSVGQTSAGRVNSRVHLTIKPRTSNTAAIEVNGLVLKKLTHLLPSRRIRNQNWDHLRNVELADPSYFEPGRIDLLLGADVYYKIIQDGLIKGREGSPIAQQTLFGWILSGEVDSDINPRRVINNFHIVADLDSQLRRFWELEDLKTEKVLTEEEQRCEQIFLDTHRRLENGRYEVALPFNNVKTQNLLGSSRTIAISRLLQMESRFKRNPALQIEYAKCLKEYLTLGHMEELKNKDMYSERDEMSPCTHTYLPHHAVTKEESVTTKLRIVFDASRRTSNGLSLNEVLLKGPTIQSELACLLLRWRKYRVAFTADIEKMYRQILVRPEHTEYQRIVWRESTAEPIKDYKLLTVTFGTKSAPYLATRVLQQLAIDEKEKYPLGSEAALNEFYVDDLLSGADTLDLATEKQKQLINLLRSGGFNLRKWTSNYSNLLDNVSKEHQENNGTFHIDTSDQVKALGLYWVPSNDYLCYSIKLDETKVICTKRTILSDVAKLYDPLGWAAPTIIIAKTFIQRLWLAKLDWDEGVPANLENEWRTFREKLKELSSVKLPRWINLSESHSGIEIHGFCDASLMAYAAVTYICVTDMQGKRKTAILSAKTKVSPIKTISLPRLELCGAVLLAKLMKYITDALQLSNYTSYAWTDSEIVLAWLKGHPSKWKTFIANRVSHIHELAGKIRWRNVPSKENPADHATRGLPPTELRDSALWWYGPKWLESPKTSWPTQRDCPNTNLEIRKRTITCLQICTENMEENYSSLTKLLRVTAYCYRFKSKERGHLKAAELQQALKLWIQKAQAKRFSEEIAALKTGQRLKGNGSISKLTPFIHSDGLLRVGGRLRLSELSFDEKFPIILPDKCHLASLIVDKAHKETQHGGPQLMMRIIRKKYWLLNARNMIRHHVHKCVPCYRQRAVVQTQLMGDLPRPRVTMSRPFSHVGVDYCGPFEIRRHRGRGAKTYKGYVAIFICMAIKAIHIEIVTDLSAQGFVAAFRRFAARRGLPAEVYCDCGSNFIGGNTILTRQRQQMVDELNVEIATLIENEGVKFHFMPPGSPNFGGLWEAGVKSTKFHMKRILGNATLTYEELSTVMNQIEACLNSRPLHPMSNNPDDITALTPAHFLIGDILLTPPEPSVHANIHRLDRWQYVQNLYQSFWRRWNAEYLCRLQQRPKWMQKRRNLKIGDLVLLKEENLPPSRWLLGKILETHPGTDQLVRVVTVKTKDSVFKRPVTKICLLPIESVGAEARNDKDAMEETRA